MAFSRKGRNCPLLPGLSQGENVLRYFTGGPGAWPANLDIGAPGQDLRAPRGA